MDDLEQRLRDETRAQYERIYTKTLGAAAIGVVPAAFNMVVEVYNGFLSGYNALVSTTGVERFVAEYGTKPFSPQFIAVSTSLAMVSAAVGLIYMMKADVLSELREDDTEHRDST